MELVPWRPFGGEVSSLRQEMDKLWNSLFGRVPFSGMLGEEWAPSVDISETKDNFVIRAELPGLEVNDVNVAVSGDLLTIKGEKKKEKEDKDEHHYCSERYYGDFQRVFQLPAGVKADKVDATFKKGVLKVTLPKAEETKRKEIEIKVN
jgi:HSP20 family protein